MDKSAQNLAPTRRIEVRANHEGPGFLLVAVTARPDAGYVETLLNVKGYVENQGDAQALAEATARCVEQATGVMYAY